MARVVFEAVANKTWTLTEFMSEMDTVIRHTPDCDVMIVKLDAGVSISGEVCAVLTIEQKEPDQPGS